MMFVENHHSKLENERVLKHIQQSLGNQNWNAFHTSKIQFSIWFDGFSLFTVIFSYLPFEQETKWNFLHSNFSVLSLFHRKCVNFLHFSRQTIVICIKVVKIIIFPPEIRIPSNSVSSMHKTILFSEGILHGEHKNTFDG